MAVYSVKPQLNNGGGGSEKYTAVVYGEGESYELYVTIEVEDNTLETYSDLVNYLVAKGYATGEASWGGPILSCVGQNVEFENYCGIHVATSAEPYALALISANNSPDEHIQDNENFSISYLGQEA